MESSPGSLASQGRQKLYSYEGRHALCMHYVGDLDASERAPSPNKGVSQTKSSQAVHLCAQAAAFRHMVEDIATSFSSDAVHLEMQLRDRSCMPCMIEAAEREVVALLPAAFYVVLPVRCHPEMLSGITSVMVKPVSLSRMPQ